MSKVRTAMAIKVSELGGRAPKMLREAERRGSFVVVTRKGKPAALILPINSEEAEEYVLAHDPDIARSLREAERDFRTGQTATLRELRARRGI